MWLDAGSLQLTVPDFEQIRIEEMRREETAFLCCVRAPRYNDSFCLLVNHGTYDASPSSRDSSQGIRLRQTLKFRPTLSDITLTVKKYGKSKMFVFVNTQPSLYNGTNKNIQ